jgi:ribosomal protein S18 acetylase RimI-like enzyme
MTGQREAPRLPALGSATWLVLGESHLAAVQQLFLRCTDFVERIEGRPTRGDEATHLLEDLPPGRGPSDKLALGVVQQGELVAVIDLVRDFPRPGTWYVGLLLLVPECRRTGLGERIHAALAAWIAQQGGSRLRLIVQEQNPAALRFWLRLGYQVCGSARQRLELRENAVTILERALP